MNEEQIRAAVLADPQLREWIEQGNDQAVADALSPSASKVPTGELYTERAIFAELGPIMAESILSKLEHFAATGNSGSSVVKRGLQWLKPNEGGLDFQNPDVKQLLTGLTVAGVLTPDELTALSALGMRPGSVSINQVGDAVAAWRPDGKIQPLPEA
jgi:hypothetical protein